LDHSSFPTCPHPYAERRNEGPQSALASLGLPPQNTQSAPLFPLTPAAVRALLTTRQCSREATARKVAGPPGLIRPRARSGRRGRLHPSWPEASYPDPESGITTPLSWGRSVTGLSPAGVLPLQAARSVTKQNINRIAHPCSPEDIPSLSECRQRFIIVVLWNSCGNEESNSGVTLHAIDRL
jgi:hypothetical protein